MQLNLKISFIKVVLYGCVFLLGGLIAASICYVVLPGTIDLACGSYTYVVPKLTRTGDIKESCHQLVDLTNQIKTQRELVRDYSSDMTCSGLSGISEGPGSNSISSVRVNNDKADAYNAVCEKYKIQLESLAVEKPDNSLGGGEKYKAYIQQKQKIRNQFMAESSIYDNNEKDLQDMIRSSSDIEEKIRGEIIVIGGGMQINRQHGLVYFSDPFVSPSPAR